MEENKKEQEKKVEEKVDTLVDLCLQKTKLPFTYSRVEIVSCTYYDPNDYDVVLRFHGFNGQKYPHSPCDWIPPVRRGKRRHQGE